MMALKCEAVGDVALFVQCSLHTCVYVTGNHLPDWEIAISLASDGLIYKIGERVKVTLAKKLAFTPDILNHSLSVYVMSRNA